MSQTALASQVGVSFRQMQKYEEGRNRLSASRLFEIARCLGVPIEDFFIEPAQSNRKAQPNAVPLPDIDDVVRLNLQRIGDNKIKRSIRALLKAVVTPTSPLTR